MSPRRFAIRPQQHAPPPSRQRRRAAAALANHRFQFAALVGRLQHPVHDFQDGKMEHIQPIQ